MFVSSIIPGFRAGMEINQSKKMAARGNPLPPPVPGLF
jgi:hypothetical protein